MEETKEVLSGAEVEDRQESSLAASLQSELTDEQLLELAEGSCTWGTGRCGS
ncbi:MAG TPA: hypothetical protein VIP46_21275 [Pyrinomonadaceae bacterium]